MFTIRFFKILLPFFAGILLFACKKNNGGNNNDGSSTAVDAEITVYGSPSNQVRQGFGCATVFNPPNTTALTGEEFDRLFGSGAGQVVLNFLRIRIASDLSLIHI